MLNKEIERCVEQYLGFVLKEQTNIYATLSGKWRYHNWQCDTDENIWSINFGRYKIFSSVRYNKDLDSIKKFTFKGCKFGDIDISDNDIDTTFSFIKDLIDKENLIKSIESQCKNEIRQFNKDDISFIRDRKLQQILN